MRVVPKRFEVLLKRSDLLEVYFFSILRLCGKKKLVES